MLAGRPLHTFISARRDAVNAHKTSGIALRICEKNFSEERSSIAGALGRFFSRSGFECAKDER